MTAQIGDKFEFDGENYSIVAKSASLDFNPVKYGIIPSSSCTACWDGYWCIYNITEEGIFLKDLYIHAHDNSYPEIEGVAVFSERGNDFNYMGHRLYKGLNIKMNYTGKILVGSKFIPKYYIHMGYQSAWAYEVLTEFVFENGNLVKANDLSDVAAKLRAKIDEDRKNADFSMRSELDLRRFIEESFSLDYAKKAWWPEL